MCSGDFDDWIAEALNEARAIERKFLEDWCEEAKVETPVGYYNKFSEQKLIIYTDRPGWLIGYKGKLIEKYQQKFREEFYMPNAIIEFVEVCSGFANFERRQRK